MALPKTTVTGRVPLPTDLVLPYGQIWFTLRRLDVDKVSKSVLMPVTVTAAVAKDGTFSIELWPNARGDRGTVYDVSAHLKVGTNRAELVVPMGPIIVPPTGPVDVSALLQISAPTPDVPDLLAQVLAAVAVAEGATVDASQVKQDRIAAEAAAAEAASAVVTDYRAETRDKLPTAGVQNGQTGYAAGRTYRFDSTKTPPWVDTGEGPFARVTALEQRVGTEPKAKLLDLQDSGGKSFAFFDEAAQLYIPGMGGKSVQDRFKTAAKDLEKLGQQVPGFDQTPFILKMTGAEGALISMIDSRGHLYLPGLQGRSVQDQLTRISDKLHQIPTGTGDTTDYMALLERKRTFDAVKDFGIPNNGTTGAHTQIQAALDKLSADFDAGKGPSVLFFPEGAYLIGEAVTPRSNVTVIGAGWGKSRFMPVGRAGAFTLVDGTMLVRSNWIDIEIDGARQDHKAPDVRMKGFFLKQFKECLFHRIYLHDTWASALGIDFPIDSWVTDSRFDNNGRGSDKDLTQISPGCSGIGIGTGVFAEEAFIISRNICTRNRNFGIFLERQKAPEGAFVSRRYIVSENVSSENGYGFGEIGAYGSIVTGNQFDKNKHHGVILDTGTLPPSQGRPHPGVRTLLANNVITRTVEGDGIHYDGSKQRAAFGFTTSGNLIEANAGAGIGLIGNATATPDFAFDGDHIVANGGRGIDVRSGAFTGVDILATRLTDNTGAAVSVEGSLDKGRMFGLTIRSLTTTTQTQALVGPGLITNFDISECLYQGAEATAVALTNTANTLTKGRNPGMTGL